MDKKVIANEAKIALDQMKTEYAQEIIKELVISSPTELDRANMTSRQNGYIGGFMSTKRAVDLSEQIANQAKALRNGEKNIPPIH